MLMRSFLSLLLKAILSLACLLRPIGWPCSEYLMLLNQSLFLFILGDELN